MSAVPTPRSPAVSTPARPPPGLTRPKKSRSRFPLPLILQPGLARASLLLMLSTSLMSFSSGDDTVSLGDFKVEKQGMGAAEVLPFACYLLTKLVKA